MLNKKQRYTIAIILTTVSLFFMTALAAHSETISGTISLPGSDTAPVGGVSVRISASNQNGSGFWGKSFTIPAGESSTAYALTVTPDRNAEIRLSYSYMGVGPYLQEGFYNRSDGTQWNYQQATLLAGGRDHQNIALTLISGNTISGTISLPGSETAPAGGIYLRIFASYSNGSGSWSDYFALPAGESSAAYALTVPPDPKAKLRIKYSYSGNEPYVQGGYYNSTDGTRWDFQQATLLAGARDHQNIALTLISGNTISGTISLPGSATTPSRGMSVKIYATDQNGAGTWSNYFTIPEDESSTVYTLIVPPDPTAELQISLDYLGGEPYLQQVFYNKSRGTQWDPQQATLLAGATDHQNITLTLLTGNTISGTISLPGSETAQVGGLSVHITASDQVGVGSWSESFTIPAGKSSTTYALTVPPDPNAKMEIFYFLRDGAYLESGFYNSPDGTQWNRQQATLLAGATDHQNIALTILTGNIISGTISLPGSDTALAGGMSVWVIASHQNGPGSWAGSFTIPKGESTTVYALRVPSVSDEELDISYQYWRDTSYLPEGFYNSADGTQWNRQQATLLAGTVGHQNVTLTLITGNTISGTISLPNSATAPEDGISANIIASNKNGPGVWSGFVTIPEGDSSNVYAFRIPPDPNMEFRVRYSYDGNEPYVQEGYYNSGDGTQRTLQQATLLVGATDHQNIAMTLLAGNTISGTIALPGSETAPAGGMSVQITASNISGTGYWKESFTIPEGGSSTLYALNVTPDYNAELRINYSYDGNEPYVQEGYYSRPDGTQWDSQQATLLDGATNHQNIALTLLTGNTISGTIALPDFDIASERGVSVYITASNQNRSGAWNQNNPETWTESFLIPAGESSTTYSLTVPPDPNFSLMISFDARGYEWNHLQFGYYSGDGTQWDVRKSSLLAGATDHQNIALTILTGNIISGTISLPGSATAPASGMHVSIYVLDKNGSGYKSWMTFTTIPAGESSATYALPVPPFPNAELRIEYIYFGNEPYLKQGYYNSVDGTRWKPQQATLLAGATDHQNIAMTLITGNIISGTISLPGSATAPAGGMRVQVAASNQNGPGYWSNHLTIPEGDSSVAYALTVTPAQNAKFKLKYRYYGAEPYLQEGCYSSTGATQWNSQQATLLPGGTDYQNIALTFIGGSTISGTISLPGSDTAPAGGMYVQISVTNPNEPVYWSVHEHVRIPKGGSSIAYSLLVPTAADAPESRVSYTYRGDRPYLQQGYYNRAGGTQWNPQQATLLAGTTDHQNIALTLLTGNIISGTIALPGSDTAPHGGMSVQISASDQNGTESWSDSVTIPTDTSSAAYALTVPPDANSAKLMVSYEYLGDGPYQQQGYYNRAAGTQWNPQQASLLAGATNHPNIALTLLTGNTISGTIALPGSTTAPDGNMSVNICWSATINQYATPSHLGHCKSISFHEGDASAAYDLTVPPDPNIEFEISYSYQGVGAYLQDGFYNSSKGVQWNSQQATLLAGATDHQNIALILLSGNTISGTISLPSSAPAPEGGTRVQIEASSQIGSESWSDDVTIPEGDSSTTYTMIVPIDQKLELLLSYYYKGDGPYMARGFFNRRNTQVDSRQATLLDCVTDHLNTALTLLSTNAIKKNIVSILFLPAILAAKNKETGNTIKEKKISILFLPPILAARKTELK